MDKLPANTRKCALWAAVRSGLERSVCGILCQPVFELLHTQGGANSLEGGGREINAQTKQGMASGRGTKKGAAGRPQTKKATRWDGLTY